MTRWQLENTKTGAYRIFASEGMARQAAVHMGWSGWNRQKYRLHPARN